MHVHKPELWSHEHHFDMDQVRHGERRTLVVALLTAGFMVFEIAGGIAFGSMALLADGMHMGSHAVALGISVAAYVYARRRARDERFSFGVGKVNSLAGFTGALLLGVFAVAMAWESVDRFIHPTAISFDAAIAVACLGLGVNLASVLLLRGEGHGHDHAHGHGHHHHGHDHNLRSAYLHVLADAITSLTAIGALLGGKLLGWTWLDPAMGIAGSLLVSRWAWGLLRETSRVLLDHQTSHEILERIRTALEGDSSDRVVDLHVWAIGPGMHAACIAVVSDAPETPDLYKSRLPDGLGLAHVTVEVHRCPGPPQQHHALAS